MGLPSPGEKTEGYHSTFSSNVLKIELFGPLNSHLSVIDVPGIFRTTTDGLTSDKDKDLVINMVRRYIKHKRTIILAVLPANVDIATQEILSMAEECDPHGQRTLGVLTKPDLIDKGAEGDIIDLVKGRKRRLRLGFCIVRNRGQNERNNSISERNRKEADFFEKDTFSAVPANRLGIPALQSRLRDLLNEITQREFPHVKTEIHSMLSRCESELQNLGPSRQSETERRNYLLEMAVKFQDASRQAMEARYSSTELFINEIMRLATRIVAKNEDFAREMSEKGHKVDFEEKDSQSQMKSEGGEESENEDEKEDDNESAGGFHMQALMTDLIQAYPELHQVLQIEHEPLRSDEDVIVWIRRAYESSRGLAIGSFEPSVLSELFREQTVNWEGIVMKYINAIIVLIHNFCQTLLSYLCPDGNVKANLWSLLVEELLKVYKIAIAQIRLILQTERHGNLLTQNHYFEEGLEKARTRWLENILAQVDLNTDKSKSWTNTFRMKELLRTEKKDHQTTIIKEIHSILTSYYRIASQRFVDNVCLQATDFHLISGPATPLRVFSPSFVGNLSPSQLELIAAEDTASATHRRQLIERIERLKEGSRVLAS